MVGTPYSAVQRSAWTVSEHRERIERLGGNTRHAPCVDAPERRQHASEGVIQRHRRTQAVALGSPICSAAKKALLTMLWWDSVAPLGEPVVPDVYWMLTGSSNSSEASRAGELGRST